MQTNFTKRSKRMNLLGRFFYGMKHIIPFVRINGREG